MSQHQHQAQYMSLWWRPLAAPTATQPQTHHSECRMRAGALPFMPASHYDLLPPLHHMQALGQQTSAQDLADANAEVDRLIVALGGLVDRQEEGQSLCPSPRPVESSTNCDFDDSGGSSPSGKGESSRSAPSAEGRSAKSSLHNEEDLIDHDEGYQTGLTRRHAAAGSPTPSLPSTPHSEVAEGSRSEDADAAAEAAPEQLQASSGEEEEGDNREVEKSVEKEAAKVTRTYADMLRTSARKLAEVASKAEEKKEETVGKKWREDNVEKKKKEDKVDKKWRDEHVEWKWWEEAETSYASGSSKKAPARPKNRLDAIIGTWKDRQNSTYVVSLDDGGSSCSVLTIRQFGARQKTKALIRVGLAKSKWADRVTWGNNAFVLAADEAASKHAANEIRWSSVRGGKDFVWCREADWDENAGDTDAKKKGKWDKDAEKNSKWDKDAEKNSKWDKDAEKSSKWSASTSSAGERDWESAPKAKKWQVKESSTKLPKDEEEEYNPDFDREDCRWSQARDGKWRARRVPPRG